MFGCNFGFDLGEYAPDKMLAYGEELTNNFKQMMVTNHHNYLAMFKRQIDAAENLRAQSRPIIIDTVVKSISGLNFGIDTTSYINRMKAVDLTDWHSAKKQLTNIIDELDKKLEA